MEARTFKATSIQSAISQIKKELGPDAMILSTRRKPQNARDPYGRDIFEVTAAPSPEHACQTNPPKTILKSNTYTTSQAASPDSGFNQRHECNFESWGAVQDQSIHIKDLLLLINKEYQLPDPIYQYPEVMQTYARLVKSGISQQRARFFLEQGCHTINGKEITGKEMAKGIMNAVFQSFSINQPFQTITNDGPHIAAFIGPTGVGKTTTIAKLAATLNLKNKKRVGLISIDGYRIGALEQLKTYAAIMGLPCLPAFTPEDVQTAIYKMRHLDFILVDTAGQSHLDEERMLELKALVGRSTKYKMTTHIVLSVTTKAADMAEAVEKFGRIKPQSYVFTKMDETRQRGGMIDQMLNHRLPVSYITNGQKVPDDIMQATPKKIMHLVFKHRYKGA